MSHEQSPDQARAAVGPIFEEALRHHQAGRLLDAERLYHQVLAVESRYADALYLLGVIAHQTGRSGIAVELIGKAIEINATNAHYHLNLGNALKKLGRAREAIIAFDTAIRLKPDFVDAHYNAGIVLKELGRLTDAIAAYDAAILLEPNFAQAHYNMANGLKELGRLSEAVAAYETAIRIKPDYAEAHSNLGFALYDLGRLSDAVAAYNAAIRLKPDFAETHSNLGMALKDLGRFNEALTHYDIATSLLTPGFEKPSVNRAILLMEMGKLSEARQAIDQALAINPQSPEAWHISCNFKTFAPDDPDIEAMESLLATAKIPRDRMLLHFALGSGWLDAGEPDRAFAHFADGNRLNRATFTYDAEATDRRMAGIADLFTAELMRRFAGAGNASEGPIFIIGMPRSGTTLIEQILASHPDIHGAGELTLLNDMVERQSGPLTSETLAKLGRDYVALARSLALARSRVVDKMPTNFLHAGLIHLILPNARIIHVRRDPVDTCLSCYTKRFVGGFNFAYDLQELGQYYRGYDALTAHWRTLLPPDRFTEVRYEDVVDDMEEEARRLITFCGLDWDEACLDFHATQRQVRTASATQVRQPIYRSSVGRWKPYAGYLGPLLAALSGTTE